MTRQKKLLIIFALCAALAVGAFVAAAVRLVNSAVAGVVEWGADAVSELGAHFESRDSVIGDIRTIYPDIILHRHDEYYRHTPDTPNHSNDRPDNIEQIYYLSNHDIDFTLRIYISLWIGWSRMYECDYDKKLDEFMTIEHLSELSDKIDPDKLCKKGTLTYVYIVGSSDDIEDAARTFEEISDLMKPYLPGEIDNDRTGDRRMLWEMLVKPEFGITLDPDDYRKTVILDDVDADTKYGDIEYIIRNKYIDLVDNETVLQTPCTPE